MVPKVLIDTAAERGIVVLDWRATESLGRKNPRRSSPPSPDSLATICYTSGTTGDPKGALLNHRHLACMVRCMEVAGTSIDNQDIHISYLPLAHIFERMLHIALIHGGARIGFYSGNGREL